MAFLDVLHHVRAKLGCCGERAEDGEYDGDFSLCLIKEETQVFLLAGQGAFIDGDRCDFFPVFRSLDGCVDDLGYAAFFYFGVVDFDAVVLDAVHAIVHGFQDVHVVSLVEIIGMFCIGHRIEIDAGQVRPEGIGNAVDVFTKDNSFDAFFLGHGFQDFLLFHNSSFTRQRRCRRLLVL